MDKQMENETDKVAESLGKIEQKIAELRAREAELKAKQKARAEAEANAFREKLNALPASVGLADVPALIAALKGISKVPGTGKGGRKLPEGAREGIVAALQTGGMTGKEIAAKFSVSVPTVQNIKKSLGLVNARS